MTHIQTATQTLYRLPENKPSSLYALYHVSAPLCSEIQTLKNLSKKCIRPERGGERPGSQGSLTCLSVMGISQGLLCPALKGTICLAEFPLCSPQCISPRNRNTGSVMMFFSSLLKDYLVIEWPYQRLMLYIAVSELT